MAVVKKRITKTRISEERPQKIVRAMSLNEFCQKRNKVLIVRGCGGLGDILMHRMMFEDFKRVMPDVELHFACPRYYHDAVKDHPCLDKILDVDEIDKSQYGVSYNTSTACGRSEMRLAPASGIHRSDIWANHCGLTLTKHDMHIHLSNEEKAEGKRLIKQAVDKEGPKVAICPISAMHNKNLSARHTVEIACGLAARGFCPFGLHHTLMAPFINNKIPAISENRMRIWMAVLDQADYVISVDTSAFHCAGGLNKPVVGIFTFINGETYGKYHEKVELVQGPCPLKHRGCYNWGICPQREEKTLPCCSELKSSEILAAFDRLTERFPSK